MASGPRVKLVGLYKMAVPVLVLLFVALLFILREAICFSLALCIFVLVFFSPFCIAITSLREECDLF